MVAQNLIFETPVAETRDCIFFVLFFGPGYGN